MSPKILQVGVVGGGDVAQIVHLPTFMFLSDLFKVVTICDISRKTADHCRAKFNIPHATTNPDDIFNDPAIDVVVILTSDEYHAPYTIAALKAGKNVLLEKPMTLSLQAADEIIDAETKAPNNARVFLGYMRRYAPSLQAFKREIASVEKIKYARVRDIIGPNAYFIGQSGAYSQKYHDDIPTEVSEDRKARLAVLLGQAWGQEPESLTAAQMDYCCLLGSLGSHGLSLMRNVLGGLPESVLASTDNARWYTAMFEYRNGTAPDDRFTCVYEMGIDSVPRFDSHVAVYGENKTVTICYDTPFVKGLGITVEIDELNEHGEKSHRSLQTSYEDAYTAELKEWYETVVHGKEVKTSANDARDDLILFKMMMDKFPEHKKIKNLSDSTPFVPSGP
ncbi:myo-inositol 2-dehydrogenase [Colletotrichum tamarilloi]|uniref:Myo-inositol 2-dehydrogenase n=1 Tax=Colletotrichum tamarilloi TaxID=1209934 RepID=A0ABQ9R8C5_9PEZI|nr:myo-inositol 2-dehydrogenase [Colletotrichum tamarilloi]KAK1497975.1 myo-inositol 2-dehydrogenase [Colletotrichum tamarilloi]